MKWCRFWLKSADVDVEEYLEIPDEVAASPNLLELEFRGWRHTMEASNDLAGCKEGREFIRRPPVDWLKNKAVSLKKEAEELAAQAARYKELADDNGGRRADTAVKWVAGSLISEQKRVGQERRKAKGKKT